MSSNQHDRTAAFVSQVWLYCLGRQPAPADLQRSVQDLMGGADPIAFFLATAECPEAMQRRSEQNAAPLLFPPGHYYSPIVQPKGLLADGFAERRKRDRLLGIQLDFIAMEILFDRLMDAIGPRVLAREAGSLSRYYSNNDMYGVGDATIMAAMLRYLKPKQWIEVGSGFSSAILLDTLDATPELETRLTFIEPNPERLDGLLRSTDRSRSRTINKFVQNVPVDVFAELRAGDVLFLDTTHVSKTGSDVNYEFFEILPRLASGVIVHFHDIFHDFEYPDHWIFSENKSWNEQYMLRAFLMYNSEFEIFFANDAFARARRDVVQRRCPIILENPGGGLWMRKRITSPNI